MATVYVDLTCPECDADVPLTFDVLVAEQRNPYGSTTVPEDISEAELESDSTCPECGTNMDTDAASDRAIELAREAC